MPAALLQSGFTQAAFDAFLAARREPGWLTDLRRKAWKTFNELAWPDRRAEEWLRTDIRLFKLDRFSLPHQLSTPAELPDALLAHGVELAGRTATLDSQPVHAELDPKWAARGVLFGSLDDLVLGLPSTRFDAETVPGQSFAVFGKADDAAVELTDVFAGAGGFAAGPMEQNAFAGRAVGGIGISMATGSATSSWVRDSPISRPAGSTWCSARPTASG